MKNTDSHLRGVLLRTGLSETSADLYLFVRTNPGCSVQAALLALGLSKSSAYRSCQELEGLGLLRVREDSQWIKSLEAKSLAPLIQDVKNRHKKDLRLLAALRYYEQDQDFIHFTSSSLEVLNEEETYQRYADLSLMNWFSILCYGNWEGLNNSNRNMVPVEKQFIQNRLKKGGKAFVIVTNTGPHTQEIVDFEGNDQEEDRKTKSIEEALKPLWINAFEGNDYVHLWYQDEAQKLFSTFVESRVLSDFYKQQFYAKI